MPCNLFNRNPIWINLNADLCIDRISYKREKDINPKSKSFNKVRTIKPSGNPCNFTCGTSWKNTGIEECVNCYSRKQQSDGCGNIRWILVNEGKCNNTPNWIETSNFICFQAQSRIIEKDFNPCSPSYNQTQIGKISGNACVNTCLPNWTNYFPYTQRCNASVSEIYQFDGCGNFRWTVGGNACNTTCVPSWVDTGQTRCNANVNEKQQSDGCGNIRWVAGGNACGTVCVPNWVNTGQVRCNSGTSEVYQADGCGNFRWTTGGTACGAGLTESTFLAYVSYNIYVGNTATNNLFRNTKDLYNAMYTSMFTGETVISTFKFNNSTLSLGNSIYLDNVIVTGNAYIGYFEGNNMKYIGITSGVVSEIGTTLTASTISETKVLFPYFTRTNSGDTGYGYLSDNGDYWKSRLRISTDNLTLSYLFSINESGSQFPFNDGTYSYDVKPYYRIGRNTKIYGVPNNYVIPNIYRGTWIELLCSAEVSSVKSPSETNEQFEIRKGNVETNFNAVFHLLVGK